MKYKELIQFEPITRVVKLVNTNEKNVAKELVKTYVFSNRMHEDVQEIILKNLNPTPNHETFGIQVVGSYGTGKSHLMSLVSAIAENASLLDLLSNDDLKNSFKKIAGKYKVLRFEIGIDKPLKDIFFSQVERFLNSEGLKFSFDESENISWKEMIQKMMSEFETKFPKFHFLIVIDELLEYLKGRRPQELSNDLMLLRQLGESCDNSRFKLMFGVQELLYRSPEFQFQAEMLNKIEDRYADIIITKEDVSYVVKERLLKKDIHQKDKIRTHLLKFSTLFEGINTNLNEFVDLFPVHPNYVSYFEKIKHGKSQREILKVLSTKFEELMEQKVPVDNPGLITYDSYWPDIARTPALLAIPDIREVRDKLEIIEDRIKMHFVDGRANRKELAERISHALAVRILCDDLDKKNGANISSLKEDLCYTISSIEEPELLTAAIETTANGLVSATGGQYVDQDPTSNEYFIRTEGGINAPQIIKEYANEVIKKDPEIADQYYFDFLQYVLELKQNTYRTGFKIWQHSLEWIDKKSYRLGYIFFGNPNERSTTEPIQQYYIFYCPLFSPINRNDGADEVYFDFSTSSDEFKDTIYLYGAAVAKDASAPTNQKQIFKSQIDIYLQKAIKLFNKEFADKTKVIYNGDVKTLKSYPLPGEGATKEMIFNSVASRLLNKYFNDKFPDYPAFSDLIQQLSKDNFDGRIKNALKKIVNQAQPSRDGEAILSGLGLWSGQNIDTQNSKYAESILRKLKEKGSDAVLNKTDIIYAHYAPQDLWYSVDFNIESQLEFVVLAALAFKGDIEINWSGGKTISATNIESLLELSNDDYFRYQFIKQPKDLPIKNLKTMFNSLGLPDYTSEIEKPETITKIVTESRKKADLVVTTKSIIAQGLKCRNVPLLDEITADKMKNELVALGVMLDGFQTYNTYGKLKAFKYTEDEIKKAFDALKYCEQIEKLKAKADKFEKLIGYLYTAQSYVVEEEKPLYDDIVANINKLGSVLNSGSEAETKKYETLLKSLVDSYAQYYLKQYAKCRISASDARKKDKILNSEKKQVCDIIKDSDLITSTEYQNWINSITSMKEADPSINKLLVLDEPYHDFNPREYYGKNNFKIHDLEEQLDIIFDKWTVAIRSILKDPAIKANLDILSSGEKKIINEFIDEKTELTKENALKIRNIISQLTQGIDKIEITIEEIRDQFKKPLTPQDAITVLTDFINTLCEGRERNKVRIIIK